VTVTARAALFQLGNVGEIPTAQRAPCLPVLVSCKSGGILRSAAVPGHSRWQQKAPSTRGWRRSAIACAAFQRL